MKKFILFFFINLLVHLPFINLPPCGTHVWRQCNTLAMSRNFAEEDMDIMQPKIDRRNESNGITGSHFPLYEWLLAACSKLFGFSDMLARIFSLLVFSFAMLAFYKLLIHFNITDIAAKTCTLLLLSIPELYYHSMNALPDILALCLALYGMVYWLKYQKNNAVGYLIPAIIFSASAGLVKLQFLMIPLAALAYVPFKFKIYLKYFAIWAGIIAIVSSWYYYALELTKINNLKEYGLWIKSIPLSQKVLTVKNNLLMDLPEVLIGWPLFLAFLFLFFKTFKAWKTSSLTWFTLSWLFMFIIFYVVAIERMNQHAYYFIPLLPLFVFIFALLARHKSIKQEFLTGLLIINFIWAFIRIIPSRWVEDKMQIPVEFSDATMRNEFTKTLPPNSRCVVGPDISGCIFFYFTHTKGYSFENPDELLTIKNGRFDINNMRAAGMQYLIIRNGQLLVPYMKDARLKRKIKSIGEFEIWEL